MKQKDASKRFMSTSEGANINCSGGAAPTTRDVSGKILLFEQAQSVP